MLSQQFRRDRKDKLCRKIFEALKQYRTEDKAKLIESSEDEYDNVSEADIPKPYRYNEKRAIKRFFG